MMRDGFIPMLRRWGFAFRSWRSYANYLNRRVNVENILAAVALSKRPLLTREECRELARYLGAADYKLTVRADGVPEAPLDLTEPPTGQTFTDVDKLFDAIGVKTDRGGDQHG